jgi:hypothetical protein
MLSFMHTSQAESVERQKDGSAFSSEEWENLLHRLPPYFAEMMLDEDKIKHLPEWKLACHVASSKTFSRSELLPRFLLYVCAQQLAGNGHEITEQRIGIEVFQRPRGYNPGEDNIVRNYARLLRKRLSDYFENEGARHTLRIEIPRGGYVPHFHRGLKDAGNHLRVSLQERSQTDEPAAAPFTPDMADEIIQASKTNHFAKRSAWVISLLLAAVIGCSVGALWSHNKEKSKAPAHALWTQLFQQNRNLMIVPPDSGLGILQNVTEQPVTLEDYASGKYLNADIAVTGLALDNENDLRKQRYTSMVGLKIATSLLQLPEFISNRSEIRDARDMSPEDFKNSNVILIGSVHTNPWVVLFEKNLNFKLVYTNKVDQSYIMNEAPIAGEQKIYRNGTNEKDNRTYGVIDYVANLHGNGHVLIIQGLNMAATQAAAETLFTQEAIRPALEKAKRADGSLQPFELLIETNSIVATAPSARILSMRISPS